MSCFAHRYRDLLSLVATAYAVTQRQREIGVRLALGPSPRSVLRLMLGQGMLLAVTGVAIGVIGAAILTRSMESVLFEIERSDPWTFAQVIGVLLGAAALGSWLPARRALANDRDGASAATSAKIQGFNRRCGVG